MESCRKCNQPARYACINCTDIYYCSSKCLKTTKKCKTKKHNLTPLRIKNTSSPMTLLTATNDYNTFNHTLTIKELVRKMKPRQSDRKAYNEGDHTTREDDLCYRCVKIPGKDMGMIATRDIAFGELILEEIPIMSEKKLFCEETLSLLESDSLEMQFQKLSNDKQSEILSLHNAFPELRRLEGIMKTNGYGSELCLTLSRFNHSCLPNVQHKVSEMNVRVVAIKDIKEGEELCTTYILMEDGISKTRDMLLSGWRFNCICPLCNEKDVNVSQNIKNDIEKYRLKFWETHSKLEDPLYVRQLSIHQYLEKINMICEAMEKGRMIRPSWISRFCYIRFELALRMQQPKAKEYIQQAYYFITIAEGVNSPTSKKYFDLMKDPQKHPYFQGWNK